MPNRRFELPGIQDLSKEQEDARALPVDGQHLIIGGPGTGKSVLALLRVRKIEGENKRYVFLVYNHLLNQSSKLLFRSTLVSQQWQSWFFNTFSQMTGEPVPRLEAPPGSTWPPISWNEATDIASKSSIPDNFDPPYLVIDEGQDMPRSFYECLVILGFENLFVVADQNQQITEECSSILDLRNALALDPEEVVELKINYRNSYAVARLARKFYTGDPATPPPDLPAPPKIQAKIPLLYEYPHDKLRSVIQRILKMSDRKPNKLIGILAPKNTVREDFFNKLIATEIVLDNGKPNISTFKSGDQHQMSFNTGGIMVINAQACKGLEFDVVFIVGLNDFRINHDAERQTKSLFYVMVARAIDTVIMLQREDAHCPVDNILPTDKNILERF